MKKIWSRVVGSGLLMAGVIGAVATTAPDAAAGNACKCDGIKVTNSSGAEIKVTKVEYRVVGTGTWYTEDLSNKNIKSGSSHTWGSQTLGSASNGDMLELKVVYENGFGTVFRSAPKTAAGACDKNHTYALTVQ